MKATATKYGFAFLPFFLLATAIFCQTSALPPAQPTLPPVFVLGEFDRQYDELAPSYGSLLDACGGDMQAAFSKLSSMMQEMEAFADLTGYELDGVSAWMHFFFRQDGSIEHVGFHLKPNSRNASTDGLKNFLAAFAKQYKFPLSANVKYLHYSSFSFPLVFKKPPPTDSTAKKNN